jgi:hypothetical protein
VSTGAVGLLVTVELVVATVVGAVRTGVVVRRELGAVSSESPPDDTTTATTTPATATAATAAASMAFFTKAEATLARRCENGSRSS